MVFVIRKLYEDPDTLICNEIRIGSKSNVPFKDHRGFTKASIEEDGTIKSKNRRVKTT